MATRNVRSVTPIIRLVHPQAFAAFLQSVGTPTDRLFTRLGLPVYCDAPTAFVPLRQAWALFDAAARLEDPFLGWHVGRYYGDNRLSAGLLSRLENATTLFRALQRFVRLISAEASHLELGILERADEIVFHTRYSTIKDWPGYTVSQSYQIEVFVDLVRHYAGPDWVPREIGIEYPTVPAVAKEHFPGSRIRPGRKMGYITVPRSHLHLPAQSTRRVGDASNALVLTEKFGFGDTLAAMLEPHLQNGYPSQKLAASLMDTSVRSLARKLSDSGVTYQSVVDRLRLQVAKEKLLDPDMRITDVANVVGFDDPANFTRMFRRVAGLTPRQYRQVAP